MEKVYATVEINVEIFDKEALWHHARFVHHRSRISTPFEELCGTREDPQITDCLIMIFDPGVSPEGTQISETTAQAVEV